jgi:dolichol-phosphate mannosyltransferase
VLERIGIETLKSNGYAFQVETLYRTVHAGGRVREVPIVFTERQQGRSKMSSLVMLEAAMLPWKIRAAAHASARPLSYPAGRESQ